MLSYTIYTTCTIIHYHCAFITYQHHPKCLTLSLHTCPRCAEFIQLVSSESNEVATKEVKNTISPEHVIRALEELGFSDFVDEVKVAWDQFKEESKREFLKGAASATVLAVAVCSGMQSY